MPIVARSTVSPHGRRLFLTPRYSPVKGLPIELWQQIVKFSGDAQAQSSAARALSGVSQGLRSFLLPLCFPSVTLYGDQAFILRGFLGSGLKAPTSFMHTASVLIVGRAEEVASLCSAVTYALPRLTSVSLICPTVRSPQTSRHWDAFSGSLVKLLGLGRRRLRHFAFHLDVAHSFDPSHSLDLSELVILSALGYLESLSLLIHGGLALGVDEPILLPKTLRIIRISAAALGLVRRASWPAAEDLAVVHIEDIRKRSQLKGSSESLAAASLTSTIAVALPGWTLRLRELRLFGVFMDYSAVVLVGHLRALQRLDLQPRCIVMDASATALLVGEAIISPVPPSPSREALSRSGLGPVSGSVAVLSGLEELLPALKYLLGRLRGLRMLRLGHRGSRFRDSFGSPAEAQVYHLFLFRAVSQHLLPALSLWSFARADGTEPLLHLPTCGLCSHLTAGSRSRGCMMLESEEVARNGARTDDAMPIDHLAHLLETHNRISTVGPVL